MGCFLFFKILTIHFLNLCCSETDYSKEKLYRKTILTRPSHSKNSIIYVHDYPDYKYKIADNLEINENILSEYSTQFDNLFNIFYNYEKIDVFQIIRGYSKVHRKILCYSIVVFLLLAFGFIFIDNIWMKFILIFAVLLITILFNIGINAYIIMQFTSDLVEREINIESMLNEYNDMNLSLQKDYYFRVGRYGAWIELSGLDQEISEQVLNASSKCRDEVSIVKNNKMVYPLVIVKKPKTKIQKINEEKKVNEKFNNANLEQNSNDFQFEICDDTFMSNHTHDKPSITEGLSNLEKSLSQKNNKKLKKNFQNNQLVVKKNIYRESNDSQGEDNDYRRRFKPYDWVPRRIKNLVYGIQEERNQKVPEPGENCVTITQENDENPQSDTHKKIVNNFINQPLPVNMLITEENESELKSEENSEENESQD